MDSIKFEQAHRVVNDYISAYRYETIEDDFLRKVISETINRGGKRIRPILCCIANELFSPLKEDTLRVSFAIELFHNFTLIHDDIMDEAPLRRSHPSLYSLYGRDVALLIGDVVMIEAYDAINKIEHPLKGSIYTVFNKTAKDICIGQLYDLNQQRAEEKWDKEKYLRMIRLKTAVLIGRSLYLGALIGGATEDIALSVYDIGIDVGMIFQIRDDYLDAFGDFEKVGKQRGGDIMQKKKTLLYFTAHEKLEESDKDRLRYLMENYEGKGKVDAILALYQKVDLKEEARRIESSYMESLLRRIRLLPCSLEGRERLEDFAHYLLGRTS